ncbi:MAG: hypothetical protein ACRDHE_01895, partial [Ktedonobacterales bacterium]
AFGWPWWVSGLFGLAALLVTGAALYLRLRRGQMLMAPAGVARLAMPDSVRLLRVEASVPSAPLDAANAVTTATTR